MLEPVTARELILSGARLAGAGGVWTIPGPYLITRTAFAGEPGTANNRTITIAGNNEHPGPPLMEAWDIVNFSIPVTAQLRYEKVTQAGTLSLSVQLLRNSDTVLAFTESKEQAGAAGEGSAAITTLFGKDLINPIHVDARQRLELKVAAKFSGVGTGGAGLGVFVTIGATLPSLTANPEGTPNANESFITYNSIDLTGHREL